VHDALGRRVASYQAIDGPANSQSVTLYAYSGIRVVQTAEYTATKSGGVFNLEASSEAVTSYIHGPGLDELLAMRRDGDTYLFITDVNHSVLAAVEADSGEVAEWYDYGDFGAPSIFDAAGAPLAASAIGNGRLYTGAFWDAGMRLYHLRARYLDPDTGRFTQRDPLGPWSDPLALGNPTTYAANNPWTYTDPLGLCAEKAPTQGEAYVQNEGLAEESIWQQSYRLNEEMEDNQARFLADAKYAIHRAYDAYGVGLANILFNPHGHAKGLFDRVLDPSATFAGGYGDGVSLGLTHQVRAAMGTNDFVNHWSGLYNTGLGLGVTNLALIVRGNPNAMVSVSRWGRPGLQPGDFVMRGGVNPWNYLRSGKMQRGLGNQYAPYNSGQTFRVPKRTLRGPGSAANANLFADRLTAPVKWLLGQRSYWP